MDLTWPDELIALGAEARAVAREAAAGLAVREDSWVCGYDRDFSLELGKRGWLGMVWPVEEGGHGRTALERFVVTEALIGEGAPIASSWVGDRQIGPTLLAYGTAEQRARWLPPMVRGEVTWSIGLSEPDAGSDLAALRTRAWPDGDGWRIEGRKIWTSLATDAEHCYLVARTDPEAPAHQGISDFVVDLDSPGVTVTPIRDMTGAQDFCEVTYDGVHVPADHLIGTLHGSWKQIMRQLEHERGGVDRIVSNRALFLETVARIDPSDRVLRQRAASLEARFRIGRQLVLRALGGAAPQGFSALTKVFCTEVEQDVAELCVDVLGLEGLMPGRASRNLLYAPAYSIQGGGNAILRTVLAERVLGLPR